MCFLKFYIGYINYFFNIFSHSDTKWFWQKMVLTQNDSDTFWFWHKTVLTKKVLTQNSSDTKWFWLSMCTKPKPETDFLSKPKPKPKPDFCQKPKPTTSTRYKWLFRRNNAERIIIYLFWKFIRLWFFSSSLRSERIDSTLSYGITL